MSRVIAASVAPLEHLFGWHVGVLEVVVLGVGPVRAGSRDCDSAPLREGVGIRRGSDHGAEQCDALLSNRKYKHEHKKGQCTVVVAQLVERSLPIPEVRSLNPVISKKLFILNICLLLTVY